MIGISGRPARIIELAELIATDLRGYDQAEFERDRLVIDATAFRLMHIGESAKGLDPAVRRRNGQLPWRNMAAMRNLLAHDYDGIDPAILWRTAHDHLDELRTMCLAELATIKNQGE